MSKRERTLAAVAVLCLPLVWAGCGGPEAGQGSPGQGRAGHGPQGGGTAKREAVLVEVQPVEVGPIASVYSSTGTLQAEREAVVKARVRDIRVEEGDPVDRGDVLCLLDERELRIARDRAKATAANAALKLERAQGLQTQNLISQEEFQETSHNATVSRADAELAELELSYATIRSPIPGRIAERYVDQGQEVGVGDAVFRVVDEDPLLLELHVPERLVGDLAPGQTVDLSLDASGLEMEGRIVRLAPVVDTATGTVKVTVEASPDQHVRTGSFARARVVTELHEQARIVSRDSVVSEGNDLFVFTVDDGTAHKVKVKLGFEEADRVEILEGPEAGTLVVTSGAPALQDGSPVEVLGAEKPAPGDEDRRKPDAAG